MNLQNLFKTKEVSGLEKEIEVLKNKVYELKLELVEVEDGNRQNYINSIDEQNRIEVIKQAEINKLENEIFKLKEQFKSDLEKAITQEKKSLRIQADRDEKEHTARMKKLESEYAAKIAKCDRDLENDKASYRKYLRTEHNNKLESLEKENAKLTSENISLATEVSNLKASKAIMESQNDSLIDLTDGLLETVSEITNKLAEGMSKSMPTVNANFSTPDNQIVVPGVTSVKTDNKNNGQDQKKS